MVSGLKEELLAATLAGTYLGQYHGFYYIAGPVSSEPLCWDDAQKYIAELSDGSYRMPLHRMFFLNDTPSPYIESLGKNYYWCVGITTSEPMVANMLADCVEFVFPNEQYHVLPVKMIKIGENA